MPPALPVGQRQGEGQVSPVVDDDVALGGVAEMGERGLPPVFVAEQVEAGRDADHALRVACTAVHRPAAPGEPPRQGDLRAVDGEDPVSGGPSRAGLRDSVGGSPHANATLATRKVHRMTGPHSMREASRFLESGLVRSSALVIRHKFGNRPWESRASMDLRPGNQLMRVSTLLKRDVRRPARRVRRVMRSCRWAGRAYGQLLCGSGRPLAQMSESERRGAVLSPVPGSVKAGIACVNGYVERRHSHSSE